MKPAKITLFTAAQRFLSSDGALEVDVPAGSLDASQLASTPNSIQPHITQVKPGEYTMRVIEIHGRVQRPIAAVDLVRLPMKMTLSSPKASFVDRIDAALDKDPF